MDAAGAGGAAVLDTPDQTALDEDGNVYVTGLDSDNVLRINGHCQADLGFAGPGQIALSVCGDDLATDGSTATFAVEGATPSATVFVAVSLVADPTPLLGGTLVPFPVQLLLAIPTDGDGHVAAPLGGSPGTPQLRDAGS